MTLILKRPTGAKLNLSSGNQPAAIAGVAPTLDYRFARDKREIEAVSLTDKLSYTGGNGTFIDSNGFIQRATTNVPRFTHNPATRQSQGLLLENSATNLASHSENLTTAAEGLGGNWLSLSTSVQPNAALSPAGLQDAEIITNSSVSYGNGIRYKAIPVAAVSYVFGIYLKAGSTSTATIFANREVGVERALTVCSLTSEWQRFSVVWTGTVSGNLFYHFGPGNPTDGTATGSIQAWGAQLETGSTLNTYIPTSSSAVTRTSDSAVIDGTGILTGTYTMVEKPAGCAVISGTNINLQNGHTVERVMVFPAALSAQQITDIRSAM